MKRLHVMWYYMQFWVRTCKLRICATFLIGSFFFLVWLYCIELVAHNHSVGANTEDFQCHCTRPERECVRVSVSVNSVYAEKIYIIKFENSSFLKLIPIAEHIINKDGMSKHKYQYKSLIRLLNDNLWTTVNIDREW